MLQEHRGGGLFDGGANRRYSRAPDHLSGEYRNVDNIRYETNLPITFSILEASLPTDHPLFDRNWVGHNKFLMITFHN